MKNTDILSASSAIITKAKQLGAPLVGFANIDDLKVAPSFTFAPQMPGGDKGVGSRDSTMGLKPGKVQWPEHAKALLVIAVEHPKDKPEMDWWHGRISPSGNKILVRIIRELCDWVEDTFGIGIFHFPYHIEKGGIYLKDAAAMAGLGCIGRNNMLVTPEFGPRVRLRAMALNVPMPSTGPTAFNPCLTCGDLCRKACPQKAFETQIYTQQTYGQSRLPARDGVYARSTCNQQMQKNIDHAREESAEGFENPIKIIKYCRNCEMSCPVGKIPKT